MARLSIPETSRYTLLIEQNDAQAWEDAVKVHGESEESTSRGFAGVIGDTSAEACGQKYTNSSLRKRTGAYL